MTYAWLAGMSCAATSGAGTLNRQAAMAPYCGMTSQGNVSDCEEYRKGTLSCAGRHHSTKERAWDGLGLAWPMAVLTALPEEPNREKHTTQRARRFPVRHVNMPSASVRSVGRRFA